MTAGTRSHGGAGRFIKMHEVILEEWKAGINDQEALIADPNARRDWLNSYVDRLRGVVDRRIGRDVRADRLRQVVGAGGTGDAWDG